MTKIIKSKYKASRRLGVAIWGSDKDAFNKRNYRPGQHTNSHQRQSDYLIHLKAKQRLKAHYGRINEQQFKNIFLKAYKARGNTVANVTGLLESRIDIIVYRLNLAPTIFAARQLVSHKLIKLNGRKVNIPSIRLKQGDEIELVDKAKNMSLVLDAVKKMERKIPEYLSLDPKALSGKLVIVPNDPESIPYPFKPSFNLVVEYYSH